MYRKNGARQWAAGYDGGNAAHPQRLNVRFSGSPAPATNRMNWPVCPTSWSICPFKGTRNWPTALAISEAVEGVGRHDERCNRPRDDLLLVARWPSVHADRALPVILDLILKPAPGAGRDGEGAGGHPRRTADDQRLPSPGVRPAHRPCPVARPGHGPGRGVAPRSRWRPSAWTTWAGTWNSQYRPNNTVIGIARRCQPRRSGAFRRGRYERMGSRRYADLAAGVRSPVRRRAGHPAGHSGRRKTPAFAWGYRAFSMNDPDRYAATVMNGLLGDGMSSRLFQKPAGKPRADLRLPQFTDQLP